MKPFPVVSVVVVTLNTPQSTGACLRSVFRNTTVPFEVIVVSNSRSRAIRKSLEMFPRIRLIHNLRNPGFARAANRGALASRGRYLCFLDSSALVQPRWLERLLEAVRQPAVGAVGPSSQRGEQVTDLADETLRKGDQDWLESAPHLFSCSLLIPKVVMARVGLFDERYPFGVEVVDYCFRLRRAGYRLVRIHSLLVHHQRRGSTEPRKRPRLVRFAEQQFFLKCHPLRPLRFLYRRPKVLPAPPPLPFLRSNISVWTENRALLLRLSDLELFEPRGKVPTRLLLREGLLTRCLLSPCRRIEVTVMMAAHNAERWISEAIESVLGQRFKNFELIVADDGSCDRTPEIAARYRRHPKLRFLQNPVQEGIAVTRNRILRRARGRYIAVCDADDVMLPSLLCRFAKVLDHQPHVGWIYSDHLVIDADGFPIGTAPATPPDGQREFLENMITHGGALIRREAMERAGGYDETLVTCDDYDLALKIARQWKVVALSGEIHYLRRRHSQNISRTNPWARRETDRLLQRAKGCPSPGTLLR